KQIDLPKSADGPNLSKIIRNQVSKITPFQIDEVLLNYRKIDSRRPEQDISIEVSLIHKKYADEYVRLCQLVSIHPDRLTYVEHFEGILQNTVFWIGKNRRHQNKNNIKIRLALIVLLCVLAATNLYFPIHYQNEQIRSEEQ